MMAYVGVSGIVSALTIMVGAIYSSSIKLDDNFKMLEPFRNVITGNLYVTVGILFVISIVLFVVHHILKNIHNTDKHIDKQLGVM